MSQTSIVIPAKAGTQSNKSRSPLPRALFLCWVPAFAGMTV
jgi:hypothetical protein